MRMNITPVVGYLAIAVLFSVLVLEIVLIWLDRRIGPRVFDGMATVRRMIF